MRHNLEFTKTLDGKPYKIEVHIDYKDKRLSITGEVYENHRGVGGGQCYDELTEEFGDDPRTARLVELWKRWHLNDMRAGCEHQRRSWDVAKKITVKGEEKAAGWVTQNEHPEGLLSKPCSVCAYRYGTAWLFEEVPSEVIKELRGL